MPTNRKNPKAVYIFCKSIALGADHLW